MLMMVILVIRIIDSKNDAFIIKTTQLNNWLWGWSFSTLSIMLMMLILVRIIHSKYDAFIIKTLN